MRDICGMSIRPLGLPGHQRQCFWRLQRVITVVRVISSADDGASSWQLPLLSAMELHSQSRRRKLRRTAQYLQNFDRPLGLPCYRRWCFWCRQRAVRAISLEDDGMNQWQLRLPSAIEHQSPQPPFRHFGEYRQFRLLIMKLF